MATRAPIPVDDRLTSLYEGYCHQVWRTVWALLRKAAYRVQRQTGIALTDDDLKPLRGQVLAWVIDYTQLPIDLDAADPDIKLTWEEVFQAAMRLKALN